MLAHSAIRGLANVLLAKHAFARATGGVKLFEPSIEQARDEKREMFSTLVHTNVASYGRLAMTQLPTVLLGVISTVTQVGIYKVGMAVGAAVGRLADPAMSAILPRIARLWATLQIDELKRLLYNGTRVAVGVIGPAALAVIAFREPIIQLITGDATVSGTVAILVIATVGYAINGILFWNGPLLFATGRAKWVAAMWLLGGALQVALIAVLKCPPPVRLAPP